MTIKKKTLYEQKNISCLKQFHEFINCMINKKKKKTLSG